MEHVNSEKAGSECEQAPSTTLDAGGLFLVSKEDSAGALDTGAAANLVCFRWLERRNQLLERRGYQRGTTYPSEARYHVVDGRLGELPQAADILARISGDHGKITAFLLDADTPAL